MNNIKELQKRKDPQKEEPDLKGGGEHLLKHVQERLPPTFGNKNNCNYKINLN